MASIWSAVAGAAQGFSAVKQREYEEKLKAQERANEEARELRMARAKADIAKEARVGEYQGQPTVSPDGNIYGWQHTASGLERVPMGQVSEAERAAMAKEQERVGLLGELDVESKQARIERDRAAADKNRRWQPGSGSGSGGRGLTPGQERKAEQDFIEESLEDQGFFKRNGRWMQAAPLTQKEGGVEFITGAIDPEKVVPVTSETISRIRKQARDQYRGLLAPDDEPVETSRPDWATEGAEVIGPDGKTYIIRNGVPVLKG